MAYADYLNRNTLNIYARLTVLKIKLSIIDESLKIINSSMLFMRCRFCTLHFRVSSLKKKSGQKEDRKTSLGVF